MKNFIIISLLKLLGLLPLWLSQAIGVFVSKLMRLFNSRAWQTTCRNLEVCFPDIHNNERLLLAKKSLAHTSMTAIEMFAVYRCSWSQLKPWIVDIKGEEYLDQALKSERGLIMLGLHHGNWELCSKYMAHKCPNIVFLYKPIKNTVIDRFIMEGRTRQKSVEMQPVTLKGISNVIKKVSSGWTTGIIPDQVPNDEASGRFVPFFDQPALFMTFVHRLYKKTNAQILIAVARRTDKGFVIEIQEPDKMIFSDDQQQSLLALSRNIEQIIETAPEQYQWEYKRFRIRPDTKVDLYDC
ncbi:MAG: KDO2-lipid IV(A) lauroyltransferase [Enterobacterales bacterium]